MDVRDEELNGCYAMLCSGLAIWHRMRSDGRLASAASCLKDIYAYELHAAGGGCPWRLADWDLKAAKNRLVSLGLPADDVRAASRVLARMLDGASGETAHGSMSDRMGCVEQFHNALRRVTPDWFSVLDRRAMDANLASLAREVAHVVHVERGGGVPDLEPVVALCRRPRQ